MSYVICQCESEEKPLEGISLLCVCVGWFCAWLQKWRSTFDEPERARVSFNMSASVCRLLRTVRGICILNHSVNGSRFDSDDESESKDCRTVVLLQNARANHGIPTGRGRLSAEVTVTAT